MENHVSESVLLLLLVAMLAAMLVGYGCGLVKRRHLFSLSPPLEKLSGSYDPRSHTKEH